MLPKAITYGMSVKEFWEENPDLFWAYRFSFNEREKAKEETTNFNLWLQGAYFYEAVSVAIGNSFGKTKNKYSEKPYSITKEEVENEKKKNQQELEIRVKNRIAEMQTILGQQSTTEKGKGGEING